MSAGTCSHGLLGASRSCLCPGAWCREGSMRTGVLLCCTRSSSEPPQARVMSHVLADTPVPWCTGTSTRPTQLSMKMVVHDYEHSGARWWCQQSQTLVSV